MLHRLRSLVSAGLDLLYPSRCIACGNYVSVGRAESGAPGVHEPFCESCAISVEEVGGALCRVCGLPYYDEDLAPHQAEAVSPLCGDCQRKRPPFEMARATLRYGGQVVEAVQRFKYRGASHLARPLGRMMAATLRQLGEVDLLVPVPLHPRRLRHRGYNQSLLLCRQLSAVRAREGATVGSVSVRLPVAALALARTRDTPPQVNLPKAKRRQNVVGAFAVADDKRVRGHRVVLVDDLYTTGSTATECSRVLKAAGAGSVLVLTLARAVP